MNDLPLTPAEAIATAAFITTHAAEKADLPSVGDLIQRWNGWAERLRTWGEARLPSNCTCPAAPVHCPACNQDDVAGWCTTCREALL